jgi:hypothetical protein
MNRLLLFDIAYSVIFWLVLVWGIVLIRRHRTRTVGSFMIGGTAIVSVLVFLLFHFGSLDRLLNLN